MFDKGKITSVGNKYISFDVNQQKYKDWFGKGKFTIEWTTFYKRFSAFMKRTPPEHKMNKALNLFFLIIV